MNILNMKISEGFKYTKQDRAALADIIERVSIVAHAPKTQWSFAKCARIVRDIPESGGEVSINIHSESSYKTIKRNLHRIPNLGFVSYSMS